MPVAPLPFLPLAFTSPWLLTALLMLPAIWWLLRMTPPKPQYEVFPPLRLLAQLVKPDETPSKSPWWLTLLRLLIAAAIILAIAGPVWKPQPLVLTGEKPVVLILDNGWASAPDWDVRQQQTALIIRNAQKYDAPLYLLATADPLSVGTGPFSAEQALERLQAIKPLPVEPQRQPAFAHLTNILSRTDDARIVYFSDGLAYQNDRESFTQLAQINSSSTIIYQPEITGLSGITAAINQTDALEIKLIRADFDNLSPEKSLQLIAYDNKSRQISSTTAQFASGEHATTATIKAPVELRNDIVQLQIQGASQAAANWLLDDNNKRRRVALIPAFDEDKANSLLVPMHYISNAITPFADIITTKQSSLDELVIELLQQNPTLMVMPDIGNLPQPVAQRLNDWVNQGGTLLRFAGSRLAAAQSQKLETQLDTLLPVQLRAGQRNLGGTLSWSTPQHLAPPPPNSPFSGLDLASDITVSKQVLAEPSADLAQKSWLNLADGTPLITGTNHGKGRIILFHIAPDIAWSNLLLSGSFVDLLHKIINLPTIKANQLTSDLAQGVNPEQKEELISLPPYRLMNADGTLQPATKSAKPLVQSVETPSRSSFDNPPGLYGTEDAYTALNLLDGTSTIQPLQSGELSKDLTIIPFNPDQAAITLQGPLFAVAALLLAIDSMILLWLSGQFASVLQRLRNLRKSSLIAALLIIGGSLLLSPFMPAPSYAQQSAVTAHDDSKPQDEAMINVLDVTHLAYMLTGNQQIDEISRIGLSGLSQFIADKTALEPGEPIGVDPSKDELAFYPLIYWPIDAQAAFPDELTLQKVNAYMQHGGTVIFDTRDQINNIVANSPDNANSPAAQRLRDLLQQMNIPPLAPVGNDHVLSKTFFIMRDFPGRYQGSPLWAEASINEDSTHSEATDSPLRGSDGVSPILITANDLAAAWAMDENWQPLYPTIPNDPMQRIYALRGGTNIVMYVLTGNYKSDQVHVPALLERLGR